MSLDSELRALFLWLSRARWQGRDLSTFALQIDSPDYAPNVLLPIPCRGYGGLWIDLRVVGRTPYPAKEVHAMLRSQMFRVDVCTGVDDAKRAIERYLGAAGTLIERAAP